ncbi:hypothetical protein THRCLA_11921 [Thraustotheca clavata]|uniref:Phospholipid/glycerol acyltransferase domain-containing protein n=1 Tax=Thraustotheca clavata TaxID=74557 RepID=A0A1V9Y590_9STRA|nr:hypothetical protein THRCLA_11921 [Thraustotheca clavata]
MYQVLTLVAGLVVLPAALLGLLVSLTVVGIYFEEKKLFQKKEPLKIIMFGFFWLSFSILNFALVLPLKLIVAQSELEIIAHEACQFLARTLHVAFFGPVAVEGQNNLKALKPDEAVLFVANHQTMMDITTLYFLPTNFAWVAKSVIFYMPGAGWMMKLANYVPLKRKNKDSIANMFKACQERLANKWSVIVFPQGTRNRSTFLPFKDGAFDIAKTTNVRIVPLTIVIPDDLWMWNRRGACKLVVHEPYSPVDKTKEELKEVAYAAITSAMPKLK